MHANQEPLLNPIEPPIVLPPVVVNILNPVPVVARQNPYWKLKLESKFFLNNLIFAGNSLLFFQNIFNIRNKFLWTCFLASALTSGSATLNRGVVLASMDYELSLHRPRATSVEIPYLQQYPYFRNLVVPFL